MDDRDRERAKRAAQDRIAATLRMEFLGNGPKATGGTTGWAMKPWLYFRCTRCGYYMAADPETYDECFCGDLAKDAAAGRIGSTQGDAAIEVYRAVPTETKGGDVVAR